MTKNELDLCLQSVMTILQGAQETGSLYSEYLHTDIRMMIKDDLEAIRTKQHRLPMSGLQALEQEFKS